MSNLNPHEQAPRRLVIQPNASLSWEWAGVFLASMCVVSFSIAGLFAWQGYWMILPFAGLEMAALAAGLCWSMRANHYREVVSVEESRVVIEAGYGKPEQRWEFQRSWAKVQLLTGPYRNSPSRISISSHGQACVLGGCLNEDEREAVATRLAHWVKRDGVRDQA